jgi:DNA-directed RNA polymerase subunit RPC12/RpoP
VSPPLILEAEDRLRCPHCDADQGGPARGYPKVGKRGPESRESYLCERCDSEFSAEWIGDSILVAKE